MKERILKYADFKISYMCLFYGDIHEEWKNEKDDRAMFCHIYESIIKALIELGNTDNVYLRCAVSDKIKEDEKVLKRIMKKYGLKSL